MRSLICLVPFFLLISLLTSCSGGGNYPVTPGLNTFDGDEGEIPAFQPVEASDVLYTFDSRGLQAYKAFGIYRVIFDPASMNAEIIPSRKAQAIGDTFDADLTQFLMLTPCYNCLRINGIQMVADNQVQIGFAIKHPFPNLTSRPDLHVFDVRGIVLANGNWNFPLTKAAKSETSEVNGRANVTMLANADGFTSHFDELAADPNYFNPPLDYNAVLNPYKRYFEDGGTPAFNPNNPDGHNVFPVASNWETQNYIFNLISGGSVLDFAFVLDCAYGQSATFQNRSNPYYFLPEFNRKEAWSVVTNQIGGGFYSGNTSSSVNFQVSICDWQAGLVADPSYPNIANKGGIKNKSDVAKVSIEIPGVSGLIETTGPPTGEGFIWNPYVYNLTVTNSAGAVAGNYYGITAVRDDLYKKRGPIAIPESPAGFPFPGPEIYDYSNYNIFSVRVIGSAPTIISANYPTVIFEGEYAQFTMDINEPDGDPLTYTWEQVSPASPVGLFADPSVEDAKWQAPPLYDVPLTGIDFTLRFTVQDIDGLSWNDYVVKAVEINPGPECMGISSDPYYGVVWPADPIDFFVHANDPNGDTLTYEWDFDWDGNPANFNIDATGPQYYDHQFGQPGFYKVGNRFTENRTYPNTGYCSRDFVAEGLSFDFKIDDSPEDHPGFYGQDVICLEDFGSQKSYFHVAWADLDDDDVLYANNPEMRDVFTNHQLISPGPPVGSVSDVCIAGSWPTVHVAWIEYDSSDVPAYYRVKINTSLDGGLTFGAAGGEITILATAEPNTIYSLDICEGFAPEQYFIFYMDSASGNYRCVLFISDDNGMTWGPPSTGGYFRDSVGNPADHPQIATSENGVIHTFWYDGRAVPYQYYYDWSEDGGETWNSDLLISNTSNPQEGAMAVNDSGNAFFVWTDNDGMAYVRKSQFGHPPTLDTSFSFFNFGFPNFEGIDVWTSPNGGSTIAVISGYNTSTTEWNNFYFYYDPNITSFRIFTWKVLRDQISHPKCDVRWETNPNRMKVLTTWVDERVGLAPFNDHIWGDYCYIAEPF